MYNTGWAKSRRALDCFFIIMAEILGGYWQILDRSGKKIILLSSLPTTEAACLTSYWCDNAAYSVYYAQRQVSASLWNARAYSRHKADCTASAHHHSLWQTAQCECHPVRGAQAVAASLCDSPLTWRRNTQIQMYWLWKWLESSNNCTFSHERTYFYSIYYFGSLIRFAHFMIMLREELPSFPPLTAHHWFLIIQIFEQLSWSVKQRCHEIFHCVETFFIFQDFWATCGLPWKTVCPEFIVLNIYILNHSEFWTTCACPEK